MVGKAGARSPYPPGGDAAGEGATAMSQRSPEQTAGRDGPSLGGPGGIDLPDRPAARGDRDWAEALLEAEGPILQMIGGGQACGAVLEALCRMIEGLCAGSICTILRLDPDGRHLRWAAAPNLPRAYLEAAPAVPVGPRRGSCGTAAHLGRAVLVADIETDPLWAAGRRYPLAHGLRACWSVPIRSAAGSLLGTFATYHTQPRPPAAHELRLCERSASLAGIAIERHQDEEALRAGAARLRLALEAGRMGTWDWDIRTGRIAWSDNLEAIHGLPPGGFDGTFEGFRRLIHPEDLPKVEAAVARSLRDGSEFDVEFRNLRPDGSVHWMSGRGTAVADAAGRPARMIGVGTDITERKLTEQALRQSEQRFARFMQHLPGLAWIKDLQGRYVYVNDAAERAFRTPRADLYGKTDEEVFPPATAARFREHDRRALAGGAGVQVVETLEHEDGVLHHSLVSKFPILGPDGAAALVGGMAIDITDRLRAEEALREADRRKDEFLATLAHELRNPLAPIRNALSLMEHAAGAGPEHEAERAMAERQVGHLTRLVDDLLDTARISRGKIELRTEALELAPAVRRAVEALQSSLQGRGPSLSVSLPAEPIRLQADPTRLEQVLWNLLSNAARYTEPNGRIRLEARRRGDAVVIWVRDTGVGIEPAMLPRIFEMFVQAGPRAGRAQGGLGIGLGLVRTLVELHGGTVTAHSDGPGSGSEFVVRLPILPSECGAPVEPPRDDRRPTERPLPRRRILVVDDNVDAASSLSRLLTRLYGQEVRVAHDGPAALELAPAFRPEVVILDIGMPGMDGYEVARRLRCQAECAGALLVALTGWGQESDQRRSREAGLDRHLIKPVDLEALRDVLAVAGDGDR